MFLEQVRMGRVYCPKYNNLIFLACVNPLPANDVKEELVRLLQHAAKQLYPVDQVLYLSLANLMHSKDAYRA